MIRFRLFVISALMTLLVVGTAMAQTGGTAPAGGGSGTNLKLLAPFAVGIAAFGGALGDGRAIAGACEGTARNPGAGGRIFTMLLLGLALIETLVLFTFLTLFLV
jgi:F-type H+-transporting ATPase subunit c